MLHPNDGHALGSSLIDEGVDVRHDPFDVVRLANDISLHINHDERGIGTIYQ
jgi:hypothetical protein